MNDFSIGADSKCNSWGSSLMLYAFGSNGSGQLGLGPEVGDPSSPREVPLPAQPQGRIVHLTAGGNHTVFIDENGHAFSAGNNEDGRCGRLSTDLRWQPDFTAVNILQRATHAAATWSASTVVDSLSGYVWAAGSGNGGELGLGHGLTLACEWQLIPEFPPANTKIIQLTSGMAHTVAVLSNGEVYGWGKGRKGQIGKPNGDVWVPRRIEGIPFHAMDAVCGKDFTCLFGNPDTGELSVLGHGNNDRFGVRTEAPKAVPGWTQVAASWGSVFVLKAAGEVLAWGRNDHGQLPPTNLPPISMIAAGSEHCLALSKAGDVLAWGWGEHGNCGEPTDTNGDVKGRWNKVQVPFPVDRIFAGCATSFIATQEAPP